MWFLTVSHRHFIPTIQSKTATHSLARCMLIMEFVRSFCPLYDRKNYLMLSQSACQLLHLLSNSLLPHLIAAQVLPSNQSHLQHAHLQSAMVFWPQTHACPLPDCPLYCAQLSGISPRLFLTIGKQIMIIFLTYLHYSSFIKTVAKFEIAWR